MENLNKPWSCGFKNGMRNWVNFDQSIQKSEKLYLDRLFLSKAYNISARIFQSNYVSWHWRVIQNLKENRLVAWEMTWRIWLIFMQAVENLKICTLMGSFWDRRVISHDTDEWCKVLRKTDSWFLKWHEEFGKF